MERPYTQISELLEERVALEKTIDNLQASYVSYGKQRAITRYRIEIHQKELKQVREKLNALKK